MSGIPNSAPETYLLAGNFTCPECNKPVTDINDAISVDVHAHIACSKIGLHHGLSPEFRKEYNHLLEKHRVIERLNEPSGPLHKSNPFKKKRMSEEDKEEFKAFQAMRKEGLI